MSDIAQHLPQQTKTVEAIYAKYKEVGDAEPVRGYLGASIIGHPCERWLWYVFRQCCKPDFSGRMRRLFETGNLEEARFVKDLRDIGCTVYDVDEKDEQFGTSAFGGHFSGHMDGCALGIPDAPKTWHVLEFKTHNAKSFRELVKKGVKESKPQHYAQVMIYMHLTGMKRALYLAAQKDTDELYSERIRYDKAEAEALIERARRVIKCAVPPDRISTRRDYYQCGWCDAKEICWGSSESALPVPSLLCRQCCHATPAIDGKNAEWKCEKNRIIENYEERTCTDHLILPGLITFAEPIDYGTDDAGNNYITFENEDGSKWQHGNADGCFGSEELTKLPASATGRPILNIAKDLFGATVVECSKDLLFRYPDKHRVWIGPAEELPRMWKAEYGEDLLSLTPIARDLEPEYSVLEFDGARVAILWFENNAAEIRQAVPF